MLDRVLQRRSLLQAFDQFPIVAILGARQVGKTTLSRQAAAAGEGQVTRFDLEDPEDLARLAEPKLTLGDLRGLVILDEIQRRPELFPILRVLVDRPDNPARFLVLGSASPDLIRQSSESLAGRIHYHELGGFDLGEVGPENWKTLWIRGGFPRSFLATSEQASAQWRRDFIRTFLERDLPQLGIRIPAETLRRFWTMIAHYHGQFWNSAELARAFGVARSTVNRYLDILVAALVLRRLPPWHANLAKRQVKSPKIYVLDSGLLHSLLNLENHHDLLGHPKLGASFEGFALQEVIRQLGARREECFFWATQAGAELDLLITRGLKRYGFEFKYTASPRTTRSMHVAIEDLQLDRLDVIHTGDHTFLIAKNIRAVSMARLREDLEPLG